MWLQKTKVKKPKHQLEFQALLNAPNRKASVDYRRRENYYERGWHLSFGTKIKEVAFCFICKHEQCCNNEHADRRIVLNPIIRVPRKTASNTRWKQFMVEVKKFHKHIYGWLNGY